MVDDGGGDDVAYVFCVSTRHRLESDAHTLAGTVEHRAACTVINTSPTDIISNTIEVEISFNALARPF